MFALAKMCPGGVEVARIALGAYDEDPARAQTVYDSRESLINDLMVAFEIELTLPAHVWKNDKFSQFRLMALTQKKLRLDTFGTCIEQFHVLVTASQRYNGYSTRSRV